MKIYLVIFFLVVFTSCSTTNENPSMEEETELVFVNAFPNLSFIQPIDIQIPDDGTSHMFVVEKRGTIQVFSSNIEPNASEVFLSIVANVNNVGEQGLLGLAFHPNYDSNGYFYINYNPNSNLTRISRFKVSSNDPLAADENSEFIILEFPQNANNHNGGQLAFGSDGYLYISSGDGGPHINGQDRTMFTGNILRIDVDNPSNGMNYGIPLDNPFINDQNALDEIFAFGFRNPWRMSFDSATGKLWAGDVGSALIEEINIVENGGNYGWSAYEGSDCRFGPCDPNDGTIPPFFEYPRQQSGSAVTGGYVYRGNLNPEFIGKYIYGDFITGEIWALDINTQMNQLLFNTDMNISAFGIDQNKELYFCDYAAGVIYRFEQN